MRLLFIRTEIPHYALAGMLALKKRHEVLLVQLYRHTPHNYDFDRLHGGHVVLPSKGMDFRSLAKWAEDIVVTYRPEVLFVGGWGDKVLRHLFRVAYREDIPAILECDTPVRRVRILSPKTLYKRFFMSRYVRAVFAAGERARMYAESFGAELIQTGMYCHTVQQFAEARRRAGPPAKHPFRFLFVGRLVPQKNVKSLIEAFANVRRRLGCGIELEIVGSGPQEEELRRLAGNIHGVTFTGFVQPWELQKYFLLASAFLMPSIHDPWPLAILEACAYGLPVIASHRCGNTVELIRHGVTGFVFDPEKQGDLERAMEVCYHRTRSRDEWERMSRLAQGLAAPYDASLWPDKVERLLSLL